MEEYKEKPEKVKILKGKSKEELENELAEFAKVHWIRRVLKTERYIFVFYWE